MREISYRWEFWAVSVRNRSPASVSSLHHLPSPRWQLVWVLHLRTLPLNLDPLLLTQTGLESGVLSCMMTCLSLESSRMWTMKTSKLKSCTELAKTVISGPFCPIFCGINTQKLFVKYKSHCLWVVGTTSYRKKIISVCSSYYSKCYCGHFGVRFCKWNM